MQKPETSQPQWFLQAKAGYLLTWLKPFCTPSAYEVTGEQALGSLVLNLRRRQSDLLSHILARESKRLVCTIPPRNTFGL
jgi:hypothetical protein